MSRVNRYRESLNRFIKDRSCIFDKDAMPNINLESLIYNKLTESDLLLSILLLTIMNNQNKKNSKTIQGYYAATSIEILQILLNILENKEDFIKNYGEEKFHTMVEYLIICSNKSLCQNLETVKDNYDGNIATNIIINAMNTYNDTVSFSNLLNFKKLDLTNKKPSSDVKRWYIKDDKSLDKNFDKIKVIEKSSFKKYLETKIGSLSEMAFVVGWLIGCGDQKQIKRIKRAAKSFSYLYKLSKDFENIEDDIKNNKSGVSTNFVVNYGLQNSYELFMENKQKFIEDVMLLDIYTSTIKEVINYIENKVDTVIDETSPDLKSNYSNIQSIGTFV